LNKIDAVLLILAILGVSIEGFSLLLAYFQWASITPANMAFLQPYIIYGFFIGTPILVVIAIVYTYRKFSMKPQPEATYGHLEAWFFYNKKFIWEKGERDPNKHIPRQKIVLIKDTKKAHTIGDYVLKLVSDKKISWFTDDEQNNLDEWCVKKGFTPPTEEGTEERLMEPYFYAEITNKKDTYNKGDSVFFKTIYRGQLKYGLFDNMITNLEGKPFSRRRNRILRFFLRGKKSYSWSWPPSHIKNRYLMLPNEWIQGNLNGYKKHEAEWHWIIPFNAPSGKYKVAMRVYNDRQIITAIRQKEDFFIIS
jgi:hypothetical protein